MNSNLTCSKSHYQSTIQPNFEKLQRRAAKLGQKIELSIIREFVEERKSQYHSYFVDMVSLELTGEEIKIAGWIVKASIDHLEAGNVVRSFEAIPDYYRTVDCNCDHCHSKRYRTITYILQNELTGEYKQVGKSCLRDFLGIDPSIVMVFEQAMEIDGEEEEEDFRNGGSHKLEVLDVVTASAMIIRLHGYTSKAKAEEFNLQSTVNRFFDYYYDFPNKYNQDEYEAPTTEDQELAKKVIEWISNTECYNDYMQNLNVIVKGKFAEYKHMGFVVSLISTYTRFLEKESQKEKVEKLDQKVSEFLGEVGKRQIFNITVKSVKLWESQYGITHFYIMEDENGNIITWKSSTGGLEVDNNYSLLGTIKDHIVYDNKNQTELTRCKIQ